MNINTAFKSDRVCKSLTGFSIGEFRGMLEQFKICLNEAYLKRKPKRERKLGGGKKGNLPTLEHKLFTVLMYLKCYPTYDVFGFILGLDRTRAFRWIQFLFPVLEVALGRELVLPKRQIHSVREFLYFFPEVKDVFPDGTDRRVQKPKNIKKRNKLYSGKRKSTTRKNIIIADEKRRVLVLSKTKSGRRHDKKLADKMELSNLPPGVTAWVDTGFQGIQKYHKNTLIPKKKTRDKPLTERDKENNKIISSFRMAAEHAISGIKRMRSTVDVYRNRLPNFDDKLMFLSTGIWNYHLKYASLYSKG